MYLCHGLQSPLKGGIHFLLLVVLCHIARSECFAQNITYGIESLDRLGSAAKPYAPEFFGKREKLTRFGLAISGDGRECYFAVALTDGGRFREEIRLTRRNADGEWSTPQPLLRSEKQYKYVDPHFSPDGKRLYFIYTKPENGKPRNQRFDIWFVERTGKGWGEPVNIGAPISTIDAEEYFVSLTSEGTIFFGSNRSDPDNFDLYSARLGKNDRYDQPVPLPGKVNTNNYEADVFVAPDESYVVFSSSGREDGRGQGDLYVSFKDSDGNWSAGRNLGDRVNSNRQEFAPSISRDQKALFFSRGGVLYWVSTKVIEDLRP
ncbi:MAG: hypothetical protein AAGG48_11710 [Planctomycetota bacterium]